MQIRAVNFTPKRQRSPLRNKALQKAPFLAGYDGRGPKEQSGEICEKIVLQNAVKNKN